MGTIGCRNCGGPTPEGSDGKPRVYCDKPECLRERQLYPGRISAKRKRARMAARRSKVCPVCGKRKTLTAGNWGPRSDRGWQPYCIPCFRADARGRYATDPKRQAAQKARAKRQREEIRQLRAQDPEFDQEWRRKQREWRDASRVRAREVRPMRTGDDDLPALPAKPIAEFLERVVAKRSAVHQNAIESLCEQIGVNPRSLLAWRIGERQNVQFDIVDRILIRCGALWFDIYDPDRWPEEHKLARAVFDPELDESDRAA